jgi:acetylornithine/LysW-gamma-L-lysine aminotransferase
MADEKLPERAERSGEWLMAELQTLSADQIREVRGLGLMIGLELRSKVTPVLQQLMDEGVWALPAGLNVLRLLPPLVIGQEDLAQVVKALRKILA